MVRNRNPRSEYARNWYKRNPESVRKSSREWVNKQSKIFKSLKINGCAICGYNKCTASLDFHHVNPEDKNFRVNTNTFIKHSAESLVNEMNKCILLCKNCYYEIHYMKREE